MNKYKLKLLFINLSIAFQRGKMYIGLIMFLGVANIVIEINEWNSRVYWLVIPGIVIITLIIGYFDVKYVLRREVLKRNPVFEEILENQKLILKKLEKTTSNRMS